MYTPNPRDPKFGSEIRRLETPEHRRQRRRRGFIVALVGIALGIFTIAIGVAAIRTGELVVGGPGQVALPGEIVAPMGAFILVLSAWLLWRLLRNTDGI